MSIPLSQVAKEFGDGKLPKFASITIIGHYVREHGLYPRDGQMQKVEGQEISSMLRLQTLQQIEDQINNLVGEMRQASKRHGEVMEKALELASTSSDPYELHYMALMFMHEKAVLLEVVKNPNLSEKTQFLIASLSEFRKDRQVQLGLAHNPSLCSTVMEKMMGYTEDVFVLQGIAHNATRKAKLANNDSVGFAKICGQIALVQWDDTLSKAAIPGVTDPEVLRQIAENNSVIFAAEKLEMVAQNIHTPTEILERMSKTPAPLARIQHEVGIDFSTQARHTLAVKRQREMSATSGAGVQLG